MTKGTAAHGKRGRRKTHVRCPRCGSKSFHIRKKECASCSYGKTSKLKRK